MKLYISYELVYGVIQKYHCFYKCTKHWEESRGMWLKILISYTFNILAYFFSYSWQYLALKICIHFERWSFIATQLTTCGNIEITIHSKWSQYLPQVMYFWNIFLIFVHLWKHWIFGQPLSFIVLRSSQLF